MDEQAYTRLLNAVARAVAQHSRGAMQTLIALLQSGTIPRKAIRAALQQFDGEYYATLADAFSRVLGTDFGVQKVRQLPVSGLALSTHLYGMQRNLNAEVQGIIQRHAQGMHDARQLALAIYEGYGFRQREPLNLSPSNPELPKYLREALRDDTGMKADLLRLIARGQASQLRTPALRAAYLQAIDGFEQDSGGRLMEKRLDIAFQERMRYFANRIAQTELHRAYSDQKAREFMADEGLSVLQVRMSGTHPVTDICDLHAKIDKFGLGPGCYPKALAPKPGFHPFCRCVLVPRWDLSESQARERPGAERQFLTTLGERDGSRVMGSRARWLQATKGGASVADIINAGKDLLYRLGMVGDTIKHMLPKIPQAMMDGVISRAEAYSTGGFISLWAESDSLARHLRRRMAKDEVSSAEDYERRTLAVFCDATRLWVVTPANPAMRHTGKIALQSGDWIVLLSETGGIVTSYPAIAGLKSFEDRHIEAGDRVDEYTIRNDDRARIKQLLGRY